MSSIDRLDADLLCLLHRDGRASISVLSATLGVARNTVQARLTRLTRLGVIEGIRPVIDLASVGINAQAFVEIDLERSELRAVVSALADMPHTLEIHCRSGVGDLLVKIGAPSPGELQAVVETIEGINGILQTRATPIVAVQLPYRTQPLVEHVTQRCGFGRSTPRPTEA